MSITSSQERWYFTYTNHCHGKCRHARPNTPSIDDCIWVIKVNEPRLNSTWEEEYEQSQYCFQCFHNLTWGRMACTDEGTPEEFYNTPAGKWPCPYCPAPDGNSYPTLAEECKPHKLRNLLGGYTK